MDHAVSVNLDVLDAVQLALNGHHDAARERLSTLWQTLPTDDVFHRCVIAHYLADLQSDPHDELRWDQTALELALTSEPRAFEGRIPDVSYASFLPSLHLNLAASHERVGDLVAASEAASNALRAVDAVNATPLGDLTRAAIARICARLGVVVDSGSR
jgi:hypothetical protein